MRSVNEKPVRTLRSTPSEDVGKPNDMLTVNAFQTMLTSALEKQKDDILSVLSKDLQAKFDSLNAEILELKNENETLKGVISSHQSSILHLERKERECNLIITGLSDSPDAEEDSQAVHEFLEDMCPSEVSGSIKTCYRLGQYRSDKKRPVKVQLRDRNTRQIVIYKARLKLRSSSACNGVRIKPDLCAQDRSENNRLFNIFRKMKKVHPDSDIRLSRGILTVDGVECDRSDPVGNLFRFPLCPKSQE